MDILLPASCSNGILGLHLAALKNNSLRNHLTRKILEAGLTENLFETEIAT